MAVLRWRIHRSELLLEDVAGVPFRQLAHDVLFQSLGMHASTFEQPLSPRLQARAATAHDQQGGPVPGRWHIYPEGAAAGLWTTPTDLARYLIEVQCSFLGKSSTVLDQATARTMLTPYAEEQGLGFSVYGNGEEMFFGHGGSTAGFKAMVRALPYLGKGLVVMANGELGLSLLQEIVGSVAREYGWRASASPPGQVPQEPAGAGSMTAHAVAAPAGGGTCG